MGREKTGIHTQDYSKRRGFAPHLEESERVKSEVSQTLFFFEKKTSFQKYRMVVLESTLGGIERHRRSRAVIWTD